MKVDFINSINEINKEEWNKIINSDYPFLKYEFLESLEKHKCVSEDLLACFRWTITHYYYFTISTLCVFLKGKLLF